MQFLLPQKFNKIPTCCKNLGSRKIKDLIIPNRPWRFCNSDTLETGSLNIPELNMTVLEGWAQGYFHFKGSFCSRDNQILTVQKCDDDIKYLSTKHEIYFTE